MRPCFRTLIACIVFCVSLCVHVAHAGDQGIDLFEKKIRPILVDHCYQCHSDEAAAAKKLKGGLRLDTRSGTLRGGDGGPVVVPGDPGSSRLISALRYEKLKMPPNGKLSDSVVAAFVKWVKMGAPDPRDQSVPREEATADRASIDLESGRQYWAFQAPGLHSPPKVVNSAWPLCDIDRFVLAKLEDKKIPPATDAEPYSLLRRVYLDLIGLPPSPAEIEAFISETSALPRDGQPADAHRGDALEAVVDRLLASPQFGQRWARHWLDLTGYADTKGVGRSIPAPPAWRYRDYVIAALNRDKPYDQFIVEQLAGDQLALDLSIRGIIQYGEPEARAAQIAATGFLAIGPWELVKADKVQLRMDVVDGQVDRIGRAVMGLTLGCARCHDHKFDPVRQKDYYALAGIFASTVTLRGRMYLPFSDVNRAQLPETPEQLRRRAVQTESSQRRIKAKQWSHREAEGRRDDLARRINATKVELASVDGTVETELSGKLTALKEELKEAEEEVERLNEQLLLLKYLHPDPPRAIAVTDMPEPEDCRVNLRGSARDLGELVPRGFLAVASWGAKAEIDFGNSGRLELARWLVDRRHPLTARVMVNRVWHHLFGAGLVRTVDNFGLRGERPSHPELLDSLAVRFMNDGWSIKKLIRNIILSRTYRMSSVWSAPAGHALQSEAAMPSSTDPDNRLLWRANRRRLEAEAMRDTVLFVSGQLSRATGGPALPLEIVGNVDLSAIPPYIEDSAKLSPTVRFRRTIYLPVKREKPFDVMDVLDVFDLPDPNDLTGRRTVSTVPTQALYLMNAPFIQAQGRATATRVLKRSLDDRERIEWLYLSAYCRPATDAEIERDRGFLREFRDGFSAIGKSPDDSYREAWSRYCQAILVSNEFFFRN